MSFTDIYQISGSAMTAQTLRLNTVASNLANANAPASSEAQAYKDVRTSNIKGWYFKVGSMQTGVHTSKPPTYPTHQGSMFSVKL